MPFDAFIVYATAAPHTLRGFGLTQAQADARAADDAAWSAHQGRVSDIPDGADGRGEWVFDTAGAAVSRRAQSTPDLILERRAILKSLLREKEQIPGLAAWGSGALNAVLEDPPVVITHSGGARAKSYSPGSR